MKKELLENQNIIYHIKNDVHYIEFSNIKKYEHSVTHGFTTRIGGISTGECASLNLGFNRKDSRENVETNYKRVASALGIQHENMVFSNQVHDNKIKIVDENDRGKGIIRVNDIVGYDGLMTNQKGVALVTFYADCVPVFFLDPVKQVIAVSHSGWRGTVKKIAKETLELMRNTFLSNIKDIEVAIGPSIGRCCFEVGNEVAQEFLNGFPWAQQFIEKVSAEKSKINLQGIIRQTLIDSGADEEKICLSQICTQCHKDVFFSHRGDCGKTGSLAGIMQLL